MIDTGGGGFQGSSAASSGAGDNGNYTSTQDRVSKQFINVTGSSGLDASSYLGAVSNGFWNSVNTVQAVDGGGQSTNNNVVKIAAIVGGVVAVGLVALALRKRGA